jgi:hypothetical protein
MSSTNLFDIFSPRIIPHAGIDRNNPNKDYSHTSQILAGHAEIARPEYDYKWNSDGIRSIEFSTRPPVVALGCSITLGQGMPFDLSWPQLLSASIKQPVASIAYSGASANKVVSSFMGAIHQYKYKPETVIAHFANFERLYFIDGEGNKMQEWFINHKAKKTKAKAPWDYEEILPFEWVYYQNLDHIKMLEAFCEAAGIKLMWSCWSNGLTEEQEQFLKDNFKYYIPDTTKKEFPVNFELGPESKTIEELTNNYAMINWPGCHAEYKDKYSDIFDYAYDYHKIAYDYGRIKGPGAFWPHPGLHKHLHIAEFWEKNYENTWNK